MPARVLGPISAPASPRALGGSTPLPNRVYRENVVKGWISLTMTTATIADSFNVASITDNAVGDFTITWNLDFASANYACSAFGGDSGTIAFSFSHNGTLGVGSIRITARRNDNAALVDVDPLQVIAIGDH